MAQPWYASYPKSVPQEVDVDSFKNLVELFENSFNRRGNGDSRQGFGSAFFGLA